MNEIKSFTFYSEYAELIDNLSTEEEKKDILLAIFNYVFNDTEPELKGMSKAIFNNLKRPIDISKAQSKRRIKKTKEETEYKTGEEPKEEPQKNTSMMSMSNVNVKDNRDNRSVREEEKEEKDTDETGELVEMSKKIIEYLNVKLGARFKPTTKTTRSHINARLNEGYKFDDFIAVIDKKYTEWKNTEFEKYLCPDTLFGTKFEKYLNQKSISKAPKNFQNYSNKRDYEDFEDFYDKL